MTKGTKDGQNVERVVRKRYAFNSGQDSIHGSTLFQVETQESQSFGFYGSTGQGASEGGGPGTGKAVLYTPGMSTEVLGTGLKTRNPGDNSELPAKIIRCKNGDVIVDCYNGNITLRGRNITLDACGGGNKDGRKGGDIKYKQFLLKMGDPINIIDLARRMIELSGLKERSISNPNGDIEIKTIGLRKHKLTSGKPNQPKAPSPKRKL